VWYFGSFVAAGILLIRKAKIGLWLVYLWSAAFVYLFFADITAWRLRVREEIYEVLFGGVCLTIWILAAKYFHDRRSQFTGWLGSPD
jgi:hypothetical protein